MSLFLAATLVASATTLPTCQWTPGDDPFVGDVAAAVDRYTDIPPAQRAALKVRLAAHRYDDLAHITRGSINGRYRYKDLREMNFGTGRVCNSVTRDTWAPQADAPGLVYCEGSHCLIVPTAHGNLGRVTREPEHATAGGGGSGAGRDSGHGGGAGGSATDTALAGALQFEAPGAGPGAADAAPSFAGRLHEALPSPLSGPALHGGPPSAGWLGQGGSGGASAPSFVSGLGTGISTGSAAAGGAAGRNANTRTKANPFGNPSPLVRESVDLATHPLEARPHSADTVVPISPVPEPGTWGLMAAGLLLLHTAARAERAKRATRAVRLTQLSRA